MSQIKQENFLLIENYNMSFELAKEYLIKKDYGKALEIYDKMLRDGMASKNVIYLEMSKIYAAINDYDKALMYLFSLIGDEKSENKNIVYFEIGKIYCMIKEYAKAVENLEKALEETNETGEMFLSVAILLIKTYKNVHKHDFAAELLEKIKNRFESHLVDETVRDMDESIYQRFPGDYEFNGNYQDLINKYIKILEGIDYRNSHILCFLAQAYNFTGRYSDTVKLYELYKDKIRDNVFFKNKFLNEYEIAAHKIDLQSKPRNMMVVLSNRCNISCIMCLTSHCKWELPKEKLEEIIKLFPYLEKIMWQGGEVLFLPYFKDILKHALIYPNMKQSLISNFQLADEEMIELIVKNNIELTISIDGVEKNTYETIRRGAKFDRLESNLELLKTLRTQIRNKMILNMNVVVMRENYHILADFVEYAHKYKFDFVCFMPMNFIPQNGVKKQKIIKEQQDIFSDIDMEELKIMSYQMLAANKKAREFGIRIESRLNTVDLTEDEIKRYESDRAIIDIYVKNKKEKIGKIISDKYADMKDGAVPEYKKISSELELNKTSVGQPSLKPEADYKLLCHLPWFSLTLDFDGSVRPDCQCNIDKNIGDLEKYSIEELWNNEKMKYYRRCIIENNYDKLCSGNCISGKITEFHLKLL